MALPVLSDVSVSLLHLCFSELTFLTHTPLPWHVWTLWSWNPDRQECQLGEKRVCYSSSTYEKVSCTTFILILLQHPASSPSVKWQALVIVAACAMCVPWGISRVTIASFNHPHFQRCLLGHLSSPPTRCPTIVMKVPTHLPRLLSRA